MTSHLTTYDAEDKILRVISGPSYLISLQRMRPGEFKVEGWANPVTQKVVDGKIVDKTPAEMEALKVKNPRLRFDTAARRPTDLTPRQPL